MKQTMLVPSAHIAELFFPDMQDESRVVDIADHLSQQPFYRFIETGMVLQPAQARRLRDISETKQVKLTQWMTFVLNQQGLNLSSPDRIQRKRSMKRACELVHRAAECGATRIAFVSGSDPGAAQREAAKSALGETLEQVGEVMSQYPQMIMQLEPLDRFAHKCQLIGPTDETLRWMQQLRRTCPRLYLAWDSAHVALNQEDPVEALRLWGALVSQLHLANAILDPHDPGYGDHHMRFGAPGFLTPAVATAIVAAARQLPNDPRLDERSIAVEMRTTPDDDRWQIEQACREFLQQALAGTGEMA
ncbi:TIM barrel protein [Pantoea brenneri]|uniref:sugar phosphate isomerase/epimerase family protein n=1 Tax=Pantoea brenneri TaxID=472694 RepID=UPI0028A0F1AD|nr:TIM barrel protein [Pantoea brenneri]